MLHATHLPFLRFPPDIFDLFGAVAGYFRERTRIPRRGRFYNDTVREQFVQQCGTARGRCAERYFSRLAWTVWQILATRTRSRVSKVGECVMNTYVQCGAKVFASADKSTHCQTNRGQPSIESNDYALDELSLIHI